MVDADPTTMHKYEKYWNQYKSHETLKGSKDFLSKNKSGLANQLFAYNLNTLSAPIYLNNDIKLIDTSESHLNAIKDLINKAKKFIHFEYYIFADGHILNYLLVLLEQKIKEGVEVKILIDHIGNLQMLKTKTIKKIISIGIEIKIFNHALKKSKISWHYRDHNKTLIVDNQYALYGSCNIADEYFNISSKLFHTTERSVLLTGEIVMSLNVLFCTHWHMYPAYCASNETLSIETNPQKYLQISSAPGKRLPIQCINSSPLLKEKNIKNNLMQLIHGASEEIIIFTPYFCPPKDIIDALILAGNTGVKIKILSPKENNFKHINRQCFLGLLMSGVEIYEYFGFNHEKITIVDGEIIYFGTYNWDFRSLYLNFETSLLIQSHTIATRLKLDMLNQFNNSYLVTIHDLKLNKGLISWTFNKIVALTRPFL